jgi:hypothetical protein
MLANIAIHSYLQPFVFPDITMFPLNIQAVRTGIISGFIIGLTALPAAAAVYTNGTTRLLLNDGEWTGEYQTKVGAQLWTGEFQSLRTLGQDGNRSLSGTFKDVQGQPWERSSSSTFCTGEFTATQSFDVRRDRTTFTMNWTVKGGQNCPSTGQTFQLQLAEPIPVPTAQGDFLPSNADTVWYGLEPGQNEFHTWDRWQVVDSTSLNCRDQPNGVVVKSYTPGQEFLSSYDARGVATAFRGSRDTDTFHSGTVTGSSWLKTKDNCYVRANISYIRPIHQ